MDATGWRLFDVAINGKTLIEDLDIWKEVGHDAALKKTVKAKVTGGELVISFPKVASGQALISAIAIATTDQDVKPAPASSSLIQNLKITDPSQADQWSVQAWMDTGNKQYSNSDVSFSALPPDLYGAEWIAAPQEAGKTKTTQLASFTVAEDADVYIAFDTISSPKPEWLKGFGNTNTVVESSLKGGQKFQVYHNHLTKGSSIELGSPGKGSMYTVAVVKASKMDPPYDLKPSTRYKAPEARLIGSGVEMDKVNDYEVATFRRASGDTVEWFVTIGVADIYALEVKYYNPLEEPLTAKFEVLANDGTLIKEDIIEAHTTRPGKWNYYNTTTGSMINAGNYIIRVISKDAKNMSLRDISVR